MSSKENPAEWAVKWNSSGRSEDPANGYAGSMKGIGISKAEKATLISKLESQSANEVYAGLLSRPNPKVSAYGTCMVGVVKGMPTFWVYGMYGSHGYSGYPKNPESGDGTGHLVGCYNEHDLTGLCSYSDVAERAKQTLLYAVKNDVCTNYHNLKLDGVLSMNPEKDVHKRAAKYLSNVGLNIPSVDTGEDKWVTVYEVKARVADSGLKLEQDAGTGARTQSGEILQLRVIRRSAEWNCSIRKDKYASVSLLKYQHTLVNQYNNGMKLAIDANDKAAADYMESMKSQHIENLNATICLLNKMT